MARAKCSIAASGSPSQTLTQPLRYHAAARVRIEHERPIDKGGAVVEVADDKGERDSPP